MLVRIRQYGGELPFRIPLIGWIFEGWYLRETAARACNGDPRAMRLLARRYCSHPDGTAERYLFSVLSAKPAPQVCDAICDEVIESGDMLLASCCREFNIAPGNATRRALFFLASGQVSACAAHDSQPGRPLLHAAYFGERETVRHRLQDCAHRFRAQALLGEALAGACDPAAVSRLSLAEWDIVVTGLIASGRHDDLFFLMTVGPLPHALHAARGLARARWAPDPVLRELWDAVAGTLPGKWTYPDPSAHAPVTAESPAAQTRSVIFSPDGSLLASEGYDGVVRIWDINRGECVATFSEPGGRAGSLLFFADSTRLVASGCDGSVEVRGARDGAIRFRICGKEGQVRAAAASPDSSLLAVAGPDGGFQLLRPDDGACVAEAGRDETLHITSLAFSRDGASLASGYDDGTIGVWPVFAGEPVWKNAGCTGRIRTIVWSDDGSAIIVLPVSGRPSILDAKDGSDRFMIPCEGPSAVLNAAADRFHVAVAYAGNELCLFEPETGRASPRIRIQRGASACISPVPGHDLLVTGGDDGMIRIFSDGSAVPHKMFRAHADRVVSLAVSYDGTLLASAGWDGTMKLWSLPDGTLIRPFPVQSGTLRCLCASGNGELLAAGTSDGLVRLWQLPAGTFLRTLDAYTGSVTAIALSSDGTRVATAGTDGAVRIWQVADGSLVTVLSGLGGMTRCLAFGSKDAELLAGGWDGIVRLFHLPDGAMLRSFPGHTGVVSATAFLPDGSGIVSGGSDATVRIWDASTGSPRVTVRADRRSVLTVAVSPDGSLIAAAGRDRSVRILRSRDGDPVAEIPGASAAVTGLVFTPGGDLLVASADDGSVAYFSIPERKHLRNFSAHPESVCGLACTGDGHTLVTAGSEGGVRLWSLPVSGPLAALTPDVTDYARNQCDSHRSGNARQQWAFLLALLRLRFCTDICLCNPPPDIDEYDIMITG